ncbi:MAG: hypothetical protein KA243_02295 [Candidatus Aminicenantes bacterium]|nr:hypothetical protein [Candidatus Aminicenantes bacterium]
MDNNQKLEELNRKFRDGEISEDDYAAEVEKTRKQEEAAPVEAPLYAEDEVSWAPSAMDAAERAFSPDDLTESAWLEEQQRDNVAHIETVRIGVEVRKIHESLAVMEDFKKLLYRRAECLVFAPMFGKPKTFLFLWKLLFLLGDAQAFVDLAMPDAEKYGLVGRKDRERFDRFCRIAVMRADRHSFNEIADALGETERTLKETFYSLIAKIDSFQLADAQREVAIVNAAYYDLARQELRAALAEGDAALTKIYAEIGKDQKAKAQAEYDAWRKRQGL